MTTANSNQPSGFIEEDAAITLLDPQVERAARIAEWIDGARRARAELGHEA